MAGRFATALPAPPDEADLESFAMFGLIDAIHQFDLDRSIRFETFAIPRIKHHIEAELRALE
jgi:RNA polymerase sigma factor for flagellar operon FliA